MWGSGGVVIRLYRLLSMVFAAVVLLATAPAAMAQATSVFVNNIADPFGLDFLPDGRLLVARQVGGSIVVEATADGVTLSQYGFFPGGSARGLTVGPGGAVYVVENANARVTILPSTCPANCMTSDYVSAPTGYEVLFDAGGNGYVSQFSNAEIFYIAAPCVSACGAVMFASGGVSDGNLDLPAGMAIGWGGDLFVAASNRILRYATGCVQNCTSTVFANVNLGARGLVFDAVSDSLYVASGNAGGNTIQRISSTGAVSPFATVPGGGLENMTLGPDARLYVSAPDLDQVIAVALPHFVPPAPPAAIPTLSEWAMILLAGLLMVFGAWRVTAHRQLTR